MATSKAKTGHWKPILAVAVIGAIAAGYVVTRDKGGGAESVASAVQDSDTLRIGLARGLQTFDPQNNPSYGTPLRNIFDTLVRIDGDGNFQPYLAKSFRQKDDTTWEFVLNEGVKFHNGDELTAEDVKFTLERVATDPKLLENPRMSVIKEVKVDGKYKFDIITKEPDPVLPNRLIRNAGNIIPKKYFTEHGADYFNQNPIGSGPYKIIQYNIDQQLRLERFADYFKGKVSDWDKAVLTILPDTATRVNELITDGMDLVVDIPPAEWSRVNDHEGTEIVGGESTRVMLLVANSNERFPTSDRRVRQAIDYAIDTGMIVQKLFNGIGTPTKTHITPGILGFNEKFYNTYDYDPEKAKQLLKEAGYDESNPLSLTFQMSKGRYLLDSETGQMITAMLENVGIKVKMEILENSRYVQVNSNFNDSNEALILSGYGNSMFDPSLPLDAFNSKRYFKRLGYKNEEVDALLDKAAATMDREARAEMYRRLQEILAVDLPYIYLFNDWYFTGISKKIKFSPPTSRDILIEDMPRR